MVAFADKNGIDFADHRKHLPASVHDFEPANVIKDKFALQDFASRWDFCWLCGRPAKDGQRLGLAIHHIEAGRKGRSDELTNLASLCEFPYRDTCHAKVKGAEFPQGSMLWLKWHHDPFETDWVRLAILRRSFLPDLIPVPLDNLHIHTWRD